MICLVFLNKNSLKSYSSKCTVCFSLRIMFSLMLLNCSTIHVFLLILLTGLSYLFLLLQALSFLACWLLSTWLKVSCTVLVPPRHQSAHLLSCMVERACVSCSTNSDQSTPHHNAEGITGKAILSALF